MYLGSDKRDLLRESYELSCSWLQSLKLHAPLAEEMSACLPWGLEGL